MSTLKFAETHNLVAFLEKPKESNGFKGIIDFLNASSIRYALTVDPTIYTLYIKQFWATAKVITVNGEMQIQALVDGKKVIVTETSVRRALHLKDAEGIYCLPTTTIFVELERMGAKTTVWNEFSSTMATAIILFLDKQVEGMSKHKETYAKPSHTKKVFTNMKIEGKIFSGTDTPLFFTMMVQAQQEEGEETKTKKEQRKGTKIPSSSGEPIADEATNEDHIPIHSNDPLLSGEDRLQLNELMEICTNLQKKVLDLETSKAAQA
ncbi:hypothetical protein Tco_0459206 [Tanacetum coccineum]